MTSASGAVLWLADYDAFGRAQVQEAMITNPQRFPGQYYDGESGLHYNWHRYYDPGTGRYISSDPIGLAAGVNAYAYVNGNPLLFFDPYGLEIYGYWMTKPFPEIYDVKIPLGEARRPDDWWKFWKHGFAYKAMEHRVDVHVGFQWAVQCKEAEGCRQDGWVVDGGTADWIGVYVPIATPAISRIGKYISLTNITYNLLIKPATSRGASDSSR